MKPKAFRSLSALGAGLAIALVAAGAASAEMKVRVTNSAVNPVTFNLDGKSKDIRPRKALTYTVSTLTPVYSIFFHNGVADRGEVELDQSGPYVGEDGVEYRCLTLRDDGMDVEPKDECEKKINKPKK